MWLVNEDLSCLSPLQIFPEFNKHLLAILVTLKQAITCNIIFTKMKAVINIRRVNDAATLWNVDSMFVT